MPTLWTLCSRRWACSELWTRVDDGQGGSAFKAILVLVATRSEIVATQPSTFASIFIAFPRGGARVPKRLHNGTLRCFVGPGRLDLRTLHRRTRFAGGAIGRRRWPATPYTPTADAFAARAGGRCNGAEASYWSAKCSLRRSSPPPRTRGRQHTMPFSGSVPHGTPSRAARQLEVRRSPADLY